MNAKKAVGIGLIGIGGALIIYSLLPTGQAQPENSKPNHFITIFPLDGSSLSQIDVITVTTKSGIDLLHFHVENEDGTIGFTTDIPCNADYDSCLSFTFNVGGRPMKSSGKYIWEVIATHDSIQETLTGSWTVS